MSHFNVFEGQSYLTSFLASPSQMNTLNCKKISEINSNLAPDIVTGLLRITTKFKNPKLWYDCGMGSELPQIISHYLRLNLTFIKPNDDFDGTIGWINGTNLTGPLKMISNNQVDYVINDMFMNDIWYPNLIVTSTALKENYGISFLMMKETIRLSLANYLKVFNLLIWILIFVSISIIGFVHGTILTIKSNDWNKRTIKKTIKLSLNLIFSYFNLLMCKQSSILLAKLKPRHYLMAIIPLLTIIVSNLIILSIYPNMISPPKQWCNSIECFAKSNYKFYAFVDKPSYQLLKRENKTEYKIIAERTQLFSDRGERIIKVIINLIYN